MTDYAAQARALAAHSPTVTSLKRAAPAAPAPARPTGWDRMTPAERRAHQLVAQAQGQARDRQQAVAAQKRNLPENWERGSAMDKREWLLRHGGKEFGNAER
jgi:hypothetical protein